MKKMTTFERVVLAISPCTLFMAYVAGDYRIAILVAFGIGYLLATFIHEKILEASR